MPDRAVVLCLLLWAPTGCSGGDSTGDASDGTDTNGDSGVAECGTESAAQLVIGQGSGSAFQALTPNQAVGLDVAPQGGFGVSVRAMTTGLSTDSPTDVTLDTYLDGELAGHFVAEDQTLYCQDDGRGLVWGVVVGFDSSTYATNDDLLALDGQEADLVVGVTDGDGVYAEDTVSVIIRVGGR